MNQSEALDRQVSEMFQKHGLYSTPIGITTDIKFIIRGSSLALLNRIEEKAPKPKKPSDKEFKLGEPTPPTYDEDGELTDLGHPARKSLTTRPYNDGWNDCRKKFKQILQKERERL